MILTELSLNELGRILSPIWTVLAWIAILNHTLSTENYSAIPILSIIGYHLAAIGCTYFK